MHSHSSTQQFNTCPYAYKLRKIDGLKRTAYDFGGNDRAWGIAGHAGLKVIHSGGTVAQAQDAFIQLYPNDMGGPREMAWTREGGLRTMEAYYDHYQLMIDEWETVAVESCSWDEGESSEGNLIIDWVARQRASGSLYFWDHKFKHDIKGGSLKQYDLDSQITRYTAYMMSKYGECAGAIVQMICPRFLLKAGRVNPKGWSFQIEPNVYNRSREEVEAWRQEQADWEAQIQWCKDTGRWPKSKSWSCSRCDYFDVCYAEREGGDSTSVREAMYGGVQAEMTVGIEETI